MKATLKKHDQILFDDWDDLVKGSPQGNCYALSHYLNLVSPGWHGIEVLQGETLVAIMPLPLKYRSGIGFSLQAPFVQYGGVCFGKSALEKLSSQNTYKSLSWKTKVVEAIVACIPEDVKHFSNAFAPEFDCPLPFHWQEYGLRTRYTYHLDTDKEESELLASMASNTRYEMRKAGELIVKRTDQHHNLIQLVGENIRSGRALMNAKEKSIFEKLGRDLLAHGEAFVLEAWKENQCLAAAFFVTFGEKTIYLVSAQSIAARSSGAMTRLVGEAILQSRGAGRMFDFEGSMQKGIEGFFRGFGASPVPYLHIEKNDLPLLLRWIKNLR